MNKFNGVLIVQNVLLIYLIFFIPLSLYFKSYLSYSPETYLFLALFFIFVFTINFLNGLLLNNKSLSFGFLHFYPYLYLEWKFNAILKNSYSQLELFDYQKQIIIIYLMNSHALITEGEYNHFSKFVKLNNNTIQEQSEFWQMVELTPFWVEVHEYANHYRLNRELLAQKGLNFDERKYSLIIFFFFIIYILIILVIYFNILIL